MVLAGDIGGTKTILALFSQEGGPHRPLIVGRYASNTCGSLTEIVTDFVTQHQAAPLAATFGVAGPVQDRKVRITNLPWELDADVLSESLNDVTVYLLNDLEAIAYAIPMLEVADLVMLKSGERVATGPIAIVAPGTGLGEAYLFWDGKHYQPIPSEGGHTDFAPATALELELLAYLHPRLGHVSYERVCSGLGIPNLFSFLRDTGSFLVPEWLEEALVSREDATPVIIRSALENSSEICVATLDLFIGILGSEAGNLVLQVLATGGVYLGGGIPPRIVPQLQGRTFLEAFTRKGRLTDLLSRVSVDVITNPSAALFGAANHCLTMVEESSFQVDHGGNQN